jgi:hypothetical protein
MSARSLVAIVWTYTLASCFLASGSAAETTPVFGPTDYTRVAGTPQTFTETFERCGTSACQIVVINGNPDGTQRISSASIFVNGAEVVRTRDLNQNVDSIVRSLDLTEENELTVTLAASRGGFLRVAVECEGSGAALSAFAPGVDLLDATTLASALTIGNTGTVDAQDVELAEIMLDGGTLISPVPLPVDLGTIAANGGTVLESTYSGDFVPTGSHPLALKGTYTAGANTFCFELDSTLRIPPASPGSGPLQMVAVPPNFVEGAPFPPRDPQGGLGLNNPAWTIPTGPFVPGGPPSDVTELLPPPALAPGGTQALGAFAEAPPIVFRAIRSLGITAGIGGTAEPSGASSGGVIFVSANSRAAFSMDGGNTFTSLNPTTIFPADAIGFCCDQIVQYVPSIDRFVWLLQGGGLSGYRLAVASPAQIIASSGTAWTYWNLPANLFGTCTGFDYPDMSTGNSFVYFSWDAGFGGCSGGLQVARTSFAGLQAGGTITIEFTDPPDSSMAWGSHITHDTSDEVFWAGHNSTSSMRVFSLREDSNTYFWRNVGVSSWPNNTPITSLTPDNQNWVNFLHNPTTQNPGGGFPKAAVIGATRRGNEVWFAWSAGTNSNFSQGHIQIAVLDQNDDFDKLQQVQVWNPDFAFAYPALSRNACSFEIGLSFEFGGGGNYQNHVVGFWGDFVAYITTASNVGSTRFGDYVTIRQAPPTMQDPGNLFTAFGYGRNSVSGSTVSDVRYVLFGRTPES